LQLPKIKNSRRSFLGKYNCYIRNYNYFSNWYLYILTYLRSWTCEKRFTSKLQILILTLTT
jgi:hypothetical protein